MTPVSQADRIASTSDSAFHHLTVASESGTLCVELDLPSDPVRSLPQRLRLARRLFVRSMEKLRPLAKVIHEDPPAFVFSSDWSEEIADVCQALDNRLQALFNQPLPAKHVDAVLGISPKERRRWSKDGRLPSAGQLSSSRTQRRFTLRVFAVDVVDRLRRDPGQIAIWREHDRHGALKGGQEMPVAQNPTPNAAIKI